MVLDYMEIGRNIRKYRIALRLKQRDLAEKINMTEQHISHIENASTKLSLPTLVAVANALSVDCNSLLGETLVGAREKIKREEIQTLLADMDEKDLHLWVDICPLIAANRYITRGRW